MIEFHIDTRVVLKTVFAHGPSTRRTLPLQGIDGKLALEKEEGIEAYLYS